MPMVLNFCDVGHGSCAGILCPNGKLIVIDAGHNSSPPWWPSTALAQNNLTIELLVLTNFDEDHLSDFANVDAVGVPQFFRANWSVTPGLLSIMKGGDLMMGPGTKAVSRILGPITSTPSGAQEDLGGVTVRGYCNICPGDFVDTNNLSYVFFASYAGHKIIFPGDLEKPGWKKLLQRPDFRAELATVTIFVASHHGRESGCCEEVFDNILDPKVVLISDSNKKHDTHETVNWYGGRVSGFSHNGQFRKVLTTRKDGHIRITFNENTFANVETQKAA